MARTKLGLTARSEQRRGFTMPTQKRIRSALNKISKRRLVDLVLFAFSMLPKTAKIKILLRVERAPKKSTKRKGSKRKAPKRRKSTKRKAPKRKSSKRKNPKRVKAGKKAARTRKRKAAKRRR